MVNERRFLTYQGIPVWRHVQVIQWAVQVVSAIVVVTLVVWFFANMANAIQDRDIPYGFSFLSRAYQTPIGEHFIPYESSDTFLYALGVGATNTMFVAISGVILATLLGIFIGVSRLSSNWIVSKLAAVYVEFFRNVPLLVQLFFWFYIVLALPPVREGYVIAGRFYINNSGISLPWPHPSSFAIALTWVGMAVLAVIAGVLVGKWLSRRETRTGRPSYPLISGFATAIVIGAPGLAGIELCRRGLALPYIHAGTPGPLWAHCRRVHDAGRIAGDSAGSGDIHRLLYRRNRPRRHPVGRPGADRGSPRPGPFADEHPAQRHLSPSAAGYHPRR